MVAAPAALAQTTYYVNGACGDDSWSGTSPDCEPFDGPKATIQAGISTAVSGDTVMVAEGNLFADHITYPGGDAPMSVAIADLDRDADVDLADFGGFQAAFTGPQ
jgi:hypothetical protein